MAYKQQLEQIRRKIRQKYSADNKDIVELINQGKYYDELSEEQQIKYQEYKKSLGGVADDVSCAELEVEFMDAPEQTAFHFQLSKRQKPPTREELDKKIAEVQQILFS